MAVKDLNPQNIDIETGATIKDDKHKEKPKEPVSDAGSDKPDKEAETAT